LGTVVGLTEKKSEEGERERERETEIAPRHTYPLSITE
jgi:hypothetical protein